MPKRLPEHDDIGFYVESMRDIKLLTAEQEVSLAQTMEIGATAEAVLLGRQQAHDEAQGIVYQSLTDRLAEISSDTKVARREKREQAIIKDIAYTAGLLQRFSEEAVSDEELELLTRQGATARGAFIECNLPLAFTMAKASRHRGSLLDKIQWANLGLITAVDKFDYRKGFKFSTYASWWIRQSIGIESQGTTRNIRLPKHVEDKLGVLRGVQIELTRKLDRRPTYEELSVEMTALTGNRITPKKVKQLLDWQAPTVSLETPIGEEGDSFLRDVLYVEGEDFEQDFVEHHTVHDVARIARLVIPDSCMRDAYLKWAAGDPEAISEIAAMRSLSVRTVRAKFGRLNGAMRRALTSDESAK